MTPVTAIFLAAKWSVLAIVIANGDSILEPVSWEEAARKPNSTGVPHADQLKAIVSPAE